MPTVELRIHGVSGTPVTSMLDLSVTGTPMAMRAQLAVDPQGNAVVVWEHREGTACCCLRVNARVRSADGTLGLTQVLSAAGEDAQEPHVAVDPRGEAFAVWQERTNGKVHASVKA